MAHNAHIASLTEDLVRGFLAGVAVDEYKNAALSTFAKVQPGRTNQFEVFSRLASLEEKARILNHDPLGDALQERVHKLSSRSEKWLPEVLSFLLELSDRPVHKTKHTDLTLLRPDTPPPPLTWSDILADDPLDDQGDIWENIDFRDNRSDDNDDLESAPADISEASTKPAGSDFEAVKACAEDFIRPYEQYGLAQIKDAQFRKAGKFGDGSAPLKQQINQPQLLLTESQMIREVIFMLLGLPTSIYTRSQTDQIALSEIVTLPHVSWTSVKALLELFAEIGHKLLGVRRWIERKTNVSLEQTFQASLAARLNEVDNVLHTVQARFLDDRNRNVTTLLHLYNEVSISSRFLQQVDEILLDLERVSKSRLPFRILESLFERANANQMANDLSGYEFMARLFLDCFSTYLKLIRLWVEKGVLDGRDSVFFIKKTHEDVPLSSLWQDQFHLVTDVSCNLHAPSFLHLVARKIFNSGKSVDFLRQLNHKADGPWAQYCGEPSLGFEDVCGQAEVGLLSPFPVLFDIAFDRWVASMHHSSTSILREQLESVFGLQRSLEALEHIYFLRNGAQSSIFTFAMFERMEREHGGWNDSFTLTERIQHAYHTISSIDPQSIQIHTCAEVGRRETRHKRRPMNLLEDIRIDYKLPWPIANLIRPHSIKVYQRIFVLLAQCQRAKYLLESRKLTMCPRTAAPKPTLLTYAVRHRLLWFTNTMLFYFTHMVISATYASMRSSMKLAADVDGMIDVHNTYITQLEHRCFLTKQHGSLHQAIVSLLDLAVLYSDVDTGYVRPGVSNAHLMSGDIKAELNYDSSDESDFEADAAGTEPPAATASSDISQLSHIRDTFSKLYAFVTASVHGVSKADSALCWEMLAGTLAAGQG